MMAGRDTLSPKIWGAFEEVSVEAQRLAQEGKAGVGSREMSE